MIALHQAPLEPLADGGAAWRPIQPILIALLLLAIALYLRGFRSRVAGRLVVLTLFVSGVALVLVPDLAQELAVLVGVGRGADLVVYVGLLGLNLLVVLLFARLRACELQLTRMAREVAIAGARRAPHATGDAG